MIEACVTCLCAGGYTLTDLSCALRKGETRWFSESQARASADLQLATSARAVSVRWAERCAVHRPAPAPARPARPLVRPLGDVVPPTPKVVAPLPVVVPAVEPVVEPVVETVAPMRVVRRTKKSE